MFCLPSLLTIDHAPMSRPSNTGRGVRKLGTSEKSFIKSSVTVYTNRYQGIGGTIRSLAVCGGEETVSVPAGYPRVFCITVRLHRQHIPYALRKPTLSCVALMTPAGSMSILRTCPHCAVFISFPALSKVVHGSLTRPFPSRPSFLPLCSTFSHCVLHR